MMKFSAIYNEIYGARHIKVNWNNFCTVYDYFRAAKCYWISVFCYWNFHEIQAKILKFVLISQLFLHENTDICIKICKDIEIIVNCFWSKFLEVGRPELLNVVKFMCMHFFFVSQDLGAEPLPSEPALSTLMMNNTTFPPITAFIRWGTCTML